jgi:hypothetical protein
MLTTALINLAALLAFAVPAAKADCATAQLRPMCQFEERTAVEEWLAQQRADAEARARMWQLFGPRPSAARIEQVRLWLGEQR